MRSPHLEHRPRRDGSTGYRVKWWEVDREARSGERSHSVTFDDETNATVWLDALTAHGTAAAAAHALRQGHHPTERKTS